MRIEFPLCLQNTPVPYRSTSKLPQTTNGPNDLHFLEVLSMERHMLEPTVDTFPKSHCISYHEPKRSTRL